METIGEFPGQSGTYNDWKRMEGQQRRQEESQWQLQHSEHETAEKSQDPLVDRDSADYMTSPPLASYSALLKDGSDFELRPSFGSPPKDFRKIFQTGHAVSNKPDTDFTNQQELQVAMKFANFSLDQYSRPPPVDMPNAAPDGPAPPLGVDILPAPLARPELQSQTIWSSDDEMIVVSEEPKTKRCSTISTTPYENDRGFRKKSREKMRRHEVNDKFELLVNLLGFPNRARKKEILNEAVSTIKNLRRKCNELRRDRERLQYEINWLHNYRQSQATCLEATNM